MNLFDVFLETVRRQPDHPLIITSMETHTYQSFQIQVERLIEKLGDQGVESGQCIGLHYPNSPDYIRLTYAIWGCGACVVPIPVELSASEKAQIFHNIHMDAVISKSDILDELAAIQNSPPLFLDDEAVLIAAIQYCAHPPNQNSQNRTPKDSDSK
ncbi:MAG: AMP-binding protein [Gammaproteobacteria bacterium]|nr:AMP-binding protein [Gammaproteobacteria bacterium]